MVLEDSVPVTDTPPADRRALAERLRHLGLPAVLSPRDRARGLVRRSAGMMWSLAFLVVAAALLVRAVDVLSDHPALDTDRLVDIPTEAIGYALAAVVLTVLAPVVGLLVAIGVRHASPRIGDVLGWTGVLALLVVPVAFAGADGPTVVDTVVVTLVLLAATYAGVGSVTAWAGRRVVGELATLGPMIARVLPTFMLASLFFFYNAEIWQVMVALSWPRIVAVVAVLLVLTVFLVAVTTRDEVTELLRERAEDPDTTDGPRLRWDERLNVLFIPSLVTLIQTGLWGVLVFVFFLGFGQLSVSDATIVQWTGQPIGTYLRETYRLPFDSTLVKVAFTLAVFGGLNFAAASSIDRGHRDRFVSPLIEEAILGLETRDAYLAALRRLTAAPHTEDMVELCRTRYGATHQETTAALAAIRQTEETP